MSLDRSLKSKNALIRHRNVLSRGERIEMLADEDRWDDSQSVFGLPKVVHRKSSAGHKEKKQETPGTEAEAAAEAAAGETPTEEKKE